MGLFSFLFATCVSLEKNYMTDEERILKNWLVQKLRRLSYMWPPRKAALKKARIARGVYKCAHCNNTFGPKQINVDHIIPVVSIDGWTDWNGFIDRLFCKEEGYQILCIQDHDTKTQLENSLRPNFRSSKKTKVKNKKVAKIKARKGKLK